MKKTVAIVAAVLSVASVAMAAGPDGAALFQSKMCGACHGAGKKGGDPATWKLTKADILKVLKEGKAGGMPAFKGSDEEAGALADHVLMLKK